MYVENSSVVLDIRHQHPWLMRTLSVSPSLPFHNAESLAFVGNHSPQLDSMCALALMLSGRLRALVAACTGTGAIRWAAHRQHVISCSVHWCCFGRS